MEQLIFLAIAILYGIGVGIYRLVKWANQQISGSSAPNPIQQAIADAQRQAQGPAATSQAPMAQTPAERSAEAARTMPRQPQAGGPAVPAEATAEDFRRREQELQAESERAYTYFRRRAEELKAERDGTRISAPSAAPPTIQTIPMIAAQTPVAPIGLLQTKDDLVRAFILSEVLGPPLSRRTSPK